MAAVAAEGAEGADTVGHLAAAWSFDGSVRGGRADVYVNVRAIVY